MKLDNVIFLLKRFTDIKIQHKSYESYEYLVSKEENGKIVVFDEENNIYENWDDINKLLYCENIALFNNGWEFFPDINNKNINDIFLHVYDKSYFYLEDINFNMIKNIIDNKNKLESLYNEYENKLVFSQIRKFINICKNCDIYFETKISEKELINRGFKDIIGIGIKGVCIELYFNYINDNEYYVYSQIPFYSSDELNHFIKIIDKSLKKLIRFIENTIIYYNNLDQDTINECKRIIYLEDD